MLSKRTSVLGILSLGASLTLFSLVSHGDGPIKGKLVAGHIGKVSSQITGERSIRVQRLLVREGDRVKRGDLLARLSTEQLIADRSVAMSSLEEVEALVGVAESELAGAKLRYDRLARLKKSSAFRRAAFEDADVALRSAGSQLRRAQSSAKRAKAEVERIELEIRLADIVAPYDGIVTAILANVGAAVTQKNPDLLRLIDLSRVEIEIAVSPSKISGFQPGKKVFYSFDNGDRRTAKVRAVLAELSKNKSGIIVRLQLSSSDMPATFYDQQPVNIYLVDEPRR